MNNSMQITARFGTLHLQAESVFADGITIVSGENGAGKTSLLRCLAGLEKAQGQIIVGGQAWLDSDGGFIASPEARRIGCVWADVALLPWLSVEKNIMLGADNIAREKLKPWMSLLSEHLEIVHLLKRKTHVLSSGEAQRIALARAIYRKPAALLLDEPFSAQAPAVRQRLRKALQTIQKALNIPVIMVSHDADDAKILADQHWHMREGKLLTALSRHSPAEGDLEGLTKVVNDE